jgi:CBS domain-containing protein
MVKALVYASQVNGNADLLLPAEDIVESLIEQQRAEQGGFYDIPRNPHSIGGLRRRNRSILENSVLAEAMTRNGRVIHDDQLAAEALNMMEELKINALPVINRDGKLTGAINMHDLLRAGVI